MTILDLADLNLPACGPCPWMDAVMSEGWELSGLVDPPGPHYCALAYRAKERRFCIVTEIKPTPPAIKFVIIEGTAAVLAEWLEQNRPELCEGHVPSGSPCDDVYERLREYADHPDKELRWWELCDSVDRGEIKLGVDAGDA